MILGMREASLSLGEGERRVGVVLVGESIKEDMFDICEGVVMLVKGDRDCGGEGEGTLLEAEVGDPGREPMSSRRISLGTEITFLLLGVSYPPSF